MAATRAGGEPRNFLAGDEDQGGSGHEGVQFMQRYADMGVSIVMGVPQHGWFMREKTPLKWMISGYPISGNHHILVRVVRALKIFKDALFACLR